MFHYGNLGQPAVVAPSTIEVGEEQIVLVSLPGVSAFQTTDFTGDGIADEPNVQLKVTFITETGISLSDFPLSDGHRAWGWALQMTLPPQRASKQRVFGNYS